MLAKRLAAPLLFSLLFSLSGCDEQSSDNADSGNTQPTDAAGNPPDASGSDASGGSDDSGTVVTDAGNTTADAGSSGGTPLPSGITELTFMQTVDGSEVAREYTLHAPETITPGTRYPVVFCLHGAGGNARGFRGGFGRFVNDERMVGIYPQGYNSVWNLEGSRSAEMSTADEVAFLSGIVEALRAYDQLDLSRVFIFGSSNGSAMAHRMAVRTTLFKGIAGEVAQLSTDTPPTDATPAVAVMQILGMLDRTVPYAPMADEVIADPMGVPLYSGEESARVWATHNGCTVPGMTDDNETRIRVSYTGCRDGVRVLHYGYKMLGHDTPGMIDGVLSNEAIIRFFESIP